MIFALTTPARPGPRASGSGCWCRPPTPRRRSAGGSPATCTTGSSRTSPAPPSPCTPLTARRGALARAVRARRARRATSLRGVAAVAAVAARRDPPARPRRRRAGGGAGGPDGPGRRRRADGDRHRSTGVDRRVPTRPSRWSGGSRRRRCATRMRHARATPARRPGGAARATRSTLERASTTGVGFDARRSRRRRRTSGCAGWRAWSPTPGAASTSASAPGAGHHGAPGGERDEPSSRSGWSWSTTTPWCARGLEQLLARRRRHRGRRHRRRRRRGGRPWCAATRPDVVLMDLQMPDVDGVEATRPIAGGAAAPTSWCSRRSPTASGSSPRSTRARSATCSRTPTPRTCSPASARSAAASRRCTRAPPAQLLGRPGAARPRPASELTPREAEVLELVRQGLANKQIARRLGISERTVKAHLTSAFAADRRRRPHPGRAVGRAARGHAQALTRLGLPVTLLRR